MLHIYLCGDIMLCRIDELKNKQVVCVKNGYVLGYISDVQLDTENGNLTAIVIFGRMRFLGLFGKEEDIVIPWEEIMVIGPETVLVTTEPPAFLQEKGKRMI